MRRGPVGLPGPAARGRDRDVRGARDPTHVGVLSIELHLPGCRSLKDKRAVVRPILTAARQRFAVAAAEVDHQDRHQRATLAVAAVAASASHVQDVLDEVERFVWSRPEVEVLSADRSWLDQDR